LAVIGGASLFGGVGNPIGSFRALALGGCWEPQLMALVEALEEVCSMKLNELPRQILDYLQETHRRPGARITIAELDKRFGSDPSVAVALSELVDASYVIAAGSDTVELTAEGFDAAHRNDRRNSTGKRG
jgi:hypothetical protein